jgi:antitoxin MazE
MVTTISKWGNSYGLRIPKAFLQNIQIAENDPVDITLENEKIVIKKSIEKKYKTIKERLFEFYGEDFQKISEPQAEIDWGTPVGKEAW